MNYLSQNIKHMRTLKGLTQEQFAEDLKVYKSKKDTNES